MRLTVIVPRLRPLLLTATAVLGAGVALFHAAGCTEEGCTPGEQVNCACPEGKLGVQVCNSAKAFDPCICGPGGGGGEGGAGSSASSSSSSSSSASSSGGGAGGAEPQCPPPEKDCGGECVDVSKSDEHCGGCDKPCPQGTSCKDGKCVCPGSQSLCTDVCVELQTAAKHCGYCDRDCQGAECKSGLCAATQLAGGQSQPYAVAVDAQNAYFTSAGLDNKVLQVALSGGSPKVLASGQMMPREIAVDGDVLFWTNYGMADDAAVQRFDLKKSELVTLVGAQPVGVWGLAVAGGFVYFANQKKYEVWKVASSLPPALPKSLAVNQGTPWDLAVNNTHAYWTNYTQGEVRRISVGGGGNPESIATGQGNPVGLALDGQYVYWANETAGQIKRVKLAGGSVDTIAAGQIKPLYVAVGATHIYWTNFGNGTLMRAPIGGGEAEVLASGQNEPYGIALDDKYVYWTTLSGGTIMRVVK